MKTTTQNNAILRWLKRGRTLTQYDALDLFGCWRLSARIHNLRDSGHQIETVTKRGTTFATYRLAR